MKKQSEEVYYLYLNDEIKDNLTAKNVIHLFEGPNPTFDLINAKLVDEHKKLGNAIEVNQIDWFGGAFSKEFQVFEKVGNNYQVKKPESEHSAKLFMTEGPLEILEYHQNKERYYFEQNK